MLLGKWLQILRTETICVWSQVRATDDVVVVDGVAWSVAGVAHCCPLYS